MPSVALRFDSGRQARCLRLALFMDEDNGNAPALGRGVMHGVWSFLDPRLRGDDDKVSRG